MALQALNHYTIRPVDLEKTRKFYETVLGLAVGYRPPLSFPGYWLYTGDNPTVHLIGPREADKAAPPRERGGTGLLDHIAFSCTGLSEMRERLRSHGIEHREQVIPRDGQTQIFMYDPDGIGVELNYPADETTG